MEAIDFDDGLSEQQVLESGIDTRAVEEAVESMLRALGEDPTAKDCEILPSALRACILNC
jgi:hypothetical protein